MLEQDLLNIATGIFAFVGMWLACGAVIMREELYDKLRHRHKP